MKAQELRIGNWLRSWNFNYRVESFDKEYVYFDHETDRSYDEVEPIPITEEWLVKFGFEKLPNSNATFQILRDGPGHDFTLEWDEDIEAWDVYLEDNFWIQVPILSVHQLQNLYFALTGEELTIK